MPRAAVLGKPVSHSLSPVLHKAGFAANDLNGWDYEMHEVDAAGLAAFVAGATEDFVGFSVTMPGKFAALDFADEVTVRARGVGSANTLVRTPDGWRADNTDVEGLQGALDTILGEKRPETALQIGAGGTARAAMWALASRGVRHLQIINRSDKRRELGPLASDLGVELEWFTFADDIHALAVETPLIVSTVPASAVRLYTDDLAHAPVVDVAYDPFPTALAAGAAANGYPTAMGHVVLAHQAFGQFEQFTGHAAPRQDMFAALSQALDERTRRG